MLGRGKVLINRARLKCDRKEPCGNCISRSVDCLYAPYPRRARERGQGVSMGASTGTTQQLDARIRRLEQLLSSVAAQKEQMTSDGSDSSRAGLLKPGRIMSGNNQTTYVSGTHWASIGDEIADIREDFDRATLAEPGDVPVQSHSTAPMLLGGLGTTPEMQNVLADIPPKEVADRLISRYFNSHGISYQEFWQDPDAVSTTWVGLLFGILANGTFLYMRFKDTLPGDLGSPADLLETFQRRSTECLIIAKYSTAPGPYTMEAFMINAQNEFLRFADTHLGVWVLAGVGIRLALHMGYHRDPASYPQVSVFQGEMRRRVWACIKQLDTLTSYQMGLPSMIRESQSDTRLPLNILDEDFGPDSTQLPPSRPLTELTPILYTLSKDQISAVFGEIFNRVSQGRTDAYDEIMALDRRLRSARDCISPHFQMASLQDSVIVTPYLLLRRYSLELLFQKALCILHRYHMAKSHQDPKYNFSRSTCVEAAMETLRHQANILKEVQVGGMLHGHKWLLSSLEQSDFLLASMILCLELKSRASDTDVCAHNGGTEQGFSKFSRVDLINALQGSHNYLTELKESSREAKNALSVLSAMLDKFSGNGEAQASQLGASTASTISTETLQHSDQSKSSDLAVSCLISNNM
ncbi:hypothetical protein GQ53DRAFT_631746 [Thozetella sp. PMI_491]|nr:hypothetical protein GQ53DRAFT_631746 [Thozetella sp. PMI_491]